MVVWTRLLIIFFFLIIKVVYIQYMCVYVYGSWHIKKVTRFAPASPAPSLSPQTFPGGELGCSSERDERTDEGHCAFFLPF